MVYTCVGELTVLGFESKKKRLMDELDKIDHSDQSDASTILAHELKEVAGSSKMSDTINKLFSKCSTPNTSKVKCITYRMMMSKDPSTKKGTKRKASIVIDDGENAAEPEKKKVEKPIVVEMIYMPNMTVTIPQGHYKKKLEDAGRVKHLKYSKSDTCQEIKARIIGLFPSVFGNNSTKEFSFLDARKYL